MKNLIHTSALMAIVLISLYSCEKEDNEPESVLTAGTVTIEKTEVNCCQLSNGLTGTQFTYSIPYEAPDGMEVVRVEYTSKRSNGSTNSGEYNTAPDTHDGVINGYITLVFTTSDWVEESYTLVSSTGLKSNPTVIRFDKPPGAN